MPGISCDAEICFVAGKGIRGFKRKQVHASTISCDAYDALKLSCWAHAGSHLSL